MSKFLNIENILLNKSDIAYIIFNPNNTSIEIFDKFNNKFLFENLQIQTFEDYIIDIKNKTKMYSLIYNEYLNLDLVSSIELVKNYKDNMFMAKVTWNTNSDLPKTFIIDSNVFNYDELSNNVIEEILKYD